MNSLSIISIGSTCIISFKIMILITTYYNDFTVTSIELLNLIGTARLQRNSFLLNLEERNFEWAGQLI